MSKLNVISHPLIEHKMSQIRDKHSSTKLFRESVNEVAGLITYEITRDLELVSKETETPMAKTTTYVLKKKIVIVPILRAGLGMTDGIRKMIPTAKVGHIGLFRNEKTLKPQSYYEKFPDSIESSVVLLVDPMLATGSSASYAIDRLKKSRVKNIKYVGLVGCHEGVKKLQEEHPDVDIYLAALDSKLDSNGFIVPGLGDCGDRLFGTK